MACSGAFLEMDACYLRNETFMYRAFEESVWIGPHAHHHFAFKHFPQMGS